ncbi:MAG: RNase adapter RapZ [Deltaproteobacteria bacterium]|nr:RNase adapter RapZ [Deltaproteobacteria bacterium]
MKILILTGLSGSGKSTALAALEDAGFFCVDNLPVALLPKFLELPFQTGSEATRFAFVMDLREKGFASGYKEVFADLEKKGYALEIIFLEASEETLLQRFQETRRRHPLDNGPGVLEGICLEKTQLADIRRIATRVIDTSSTTSHELKKIVKDSVSHLATQPRMQVSVLSFGFKHGPPRNADLVMDVRFLANPFFVPALSPLSGEDEPVRKFVMESADTRAFMEKFLGLLDFLIPRYEVEGKAYLTIAIGCTGGRHRSVAVARSVYEHLRPTQERVSLSHRDMDQ